MKAALDILVTVWVASEILLGIFRRARGRGDQGTDRGSSALLWGVILGSVACAVVVRQTASGRVPIQIPHLDAIALVLFVAGLLLRWWAILTLGPMFTMTLAIRARHELVTAGPYRWIRHPAYAGMLVAFAASGLHFGSWVSFAVLVLPITGAVLHRIRVEEAALLEALGEPYRNYRDGTPRLVPWVF